jgi:hypothetical protein
MTDQTPAPSSGINLFEAWKEYQRIAMHFNELLMRLRSQSLAAVGALASVAGFAFKGEAGAAATNWHALIAAFGALSVFWVAIWVLDFAYYNRLLLGAVNALVAIEKASAEGKTMLDRLNLSHDIEDAVANEPTVKGRNSNGRWIFYILVFSVLLAGLGVSIYKVAASATSITQTAPPTAPQPPLQAPPATPPAAAPAAEPQLQTPP